MMKSLTMSGLITFLYQRVYNQRLNLIGYNALRKDNDRKDAVTNRQREN